MKPLSVGQEYVSDGTRWRVVSEWIGVSLAVDMPFISGHCYELRDGTRTNWHRFEKGDAFRIHRSLGPVEQEGGVMGTQVIWNIRGDKVTADVLHRSGPKVVAIWTHPATGEGHVCLLHEPTSYLLGWCDSEDEAVERMKALEGWDDSRSDATVVVDDAPSWVKDLCDKWVEEEQC